MSTEDTNLDPAPLTIPEFNPTAEQAAAVDDIIDWFRSEDEKPTFYCLQGYAGTGKTYLMTHLCRTGLRKGNDFPPIRPTQICFTAPTNKAVKVLRGYLDNAGLAECTTKTIYALLGLSLQANGEIKEIAKPEEPVDLSHFSLIVVDEASMVNIFLFNAIREACATWGIPFLFMGDPAQLPPVGELSTKVWTIPRKSLLTEVKRYGNSMLDLATAIRNVVDRPFPALKIENNPPVYRLSRGQWFEQIEADLELFRSGEAKAIAWRNATVDKYNSLIRGHIFGLREAKLNPWLPGDKLVATAMCKDLEDETFMRTDEEATVIQAVIGTHPRYTEFEIWNILVELETGVKATVRTLTPTGSFHLNNRLNELSTEAKAGKKYKWREFWTLKEAFNEVRHGYAITAHRSQGSSYIKTFVDLEDIMLNRNRQEAFRCLYVACTRQREALYIA